MRSTTTASVLKLLRRSVPLALGVALWLAAPQAPAHADDTWTGGGGNGNWSNNSNWNNGSPNSNYGTLYFNNNNNGQTTMYDDGVTSMYRLEWYDTSSWTLNPGSSTILSLTDNGGAQSQIENHSTGLVTINLPINFAATAGNNWGEINAINGGLTFGGAVGVSNGYVSSLRLYGGNTVTFNAVNTYTVETDINAGTLQVNVAPSTAQSTMYVGNGGTTGTAATLLLGGGTNGLTGGVTFGNQVSVNPGNGANRIIGGTNTSDTNTFSGNIVLDGNYGENRSATVTAAAGGTVAFSGVISGAGQGITKTGAGTVILMSASANTYTGGTTVNSGTLSGNVGSYGGGAVSVASGATVDYTQSGTGTAANYISGAGTASFGGYSGSANGSGGTVNYTGQDSAAQTNVASETVVLNRSGGSALTGPVAVATGGTVQLGSDSQIATAAPPSAVPTTAAVTLNGGTLNANGHSDGSISGTNPTAAAVTSSMGALTLGTAGTKANPSMLDFGASQSGGGPFVLAFADSSQTLGGGYLNILNYNYTGGVDALYIGNTGHLLTSSELQQIAINGVFGVSQLSNGEIGPAAAPEPSQWAAFGLGASGLGALALRARRRAAQSGAA